MGMCCAVPRGYAVHEGYCLLLYTDICLPLVSGCHLAVTLCYVVCICTTDDARLVFWCDQSWYG
jgi:hypothetical protein